MLTTDLVRVVKRTNGGNECSFAWHTTCAARDFDHVCVWIPIQHTAVQSYASASMESTAKGVYAC